MKFKTLFVVIATLLSSNVLAETAEIDLPSMLVNADFRPSLAQETPISLTTIDSELIESRGAQHIEDILNLAPNVNVSSGASRGQYFQIRGIGERSQFAAPINPSVGLIIDDIDFSRTGGAATLFDIEQIEILRGPQGTRYGTNALAGIITMQSRQPSDELEIHIETGIAEYNTRSLGVAVGGPLIDDKLLGRFSIHTHQSDGYIDNEFLNRDNTQDRDEITARGKLKWLINDDLTVDLNILHLDINNGYDAFTFDNSRNTLTDDPGQDKQRTNAFALKTDWRASDSVQLQSTITYVKSDIVYSYDADWGFDGQFAAGLFPYVGFEEFKRDRKNYSVELRALSNENGLIFNNSTEWVVGLYYLDQDEDLDQNSDFGAFGVTLLKNEYNTKNTAVFGQLDTHLDDKLTLISGLRVEYFEADYQDSNALEIDTSEVLFGGKLGLNYQASDDQLLYTSLSRGYKSGGVNTDASITPSQRDFDTEYLWSLEAGVKSSWLDGALNTNLAVFYALRRDAQVKSSLQVGPAFIDYQANAAKGKNIGIEADLDWLINHQWRVFAAVGLLDATFDEYDNPDLLADGIKISGRRQAHAPAYQFNLGGEFYFAQNWTFRANIEGKDEFYFSNSHNEKSSSYAIVNSSIDYRTGDWKVTLWGKNLFDKDYATRGFFFGNDPSIGYADRNYTQKGDPRVVGLSVSYDY
ncbi:MAG: TonB-dependent receptor [Piscirickettsiaceae bacterium]|nr:TonB-dependent receptor [Piscirickettsiaceae bacterium]